ncbi:MAG: hypothetical protein CVV51_09195, partial [Spirochaetae bacterium HGW-Spirochaetae-7]
MSTGGAERNEERLAAPGLWPCLNVRIDYADSSLTKYLYEWRFSSSEAAVSRAIVRGRRMPMTFVQACVLGLFQGVAEFLPVSSSGHLLVFKDLMGLSDVPVLFDVVLHLATLASILVVFRKRVAGILVSMARWIAHKSGEADAENLAIVPPALVATFLTAVVGLLVDKVDLGSSPKLVAGLLLVTAAILVASSRLGGGTGYRGMGWKRGIVIGLAQGIGVFPGISRSGITISAGLASGLKREEAG